MVFVPKIAAGKHALPLAYYDSIADISRLCKGKEPDFSLFSNRSQDCRLRFARGRGILLYYEIFCEKY